MGGGARRATEGTSSSVGQLQASYLNPVSALHVTLKHWPEANWQSFIFGNLEKCFRTSQTAKTFSSFTVISLVDAREGSFPSARVCEKDFKFC
jgi:hypothetical protein